MKKLLLGSVFLTMFALAISVFQISCQKDAVAQTGSNSTLPAATTNTLGGVIVGSGLSVTANGTLSTNVTSTGVTQQNKIIYSKRVNNVKEIWSANYDGTNQKKLILAPVLTALEVCIDNVSVSPDGQNLFLTASNTSGVSNIYTCKVDGSNCTKIINGAGLGTEGVYLQVAY